MFLDWTNQTNERSSKERIRNKQYEEKGNKYGKVRYMTYSARTCMLEVGGRVKNLSRVLPKMSLSSNVQVSSTNMFVYNVHNVF